MVSDADLLAVPGDHGITPAALPPPTRTATESVLRSAGFRPAAAGHSARGSACERPALSRCRAAPSRWSTSAASSSRRPAGGGLPTQMAVGCKGEWSSAGIVTRIPNSLGLRYLDLLIRGTSRLRHRPAGPGRLPAPPGRPQRGLAEAEQWNDTERASRLQAEKAFLVRELAAATGPSVPAPAAPIPRLASQAERTGKTSVEHCVLPCLSATDEAEPWS
jgi:hypothetical protein